MAYVLAQLSDIHIGGPHKGSEERFSQAIEEINAMARQPDLVLLTGDLTHNSTEAEFAELKRRLQSLVAPWEAIAGNHDQSLAEISGHRSKDLGPLRLVLLDSSSGEFHDDDAAWLDHELAQHPTDPTIVAIHHPPFETGIWWMDCVGLTGAERFETVVRQHRQVIKVLSGHVHRAIQTNWDGCSLWVCPSTSVAVAGDLDVHHDPAETAEGPVFSLHAYTGRSIVSHLVPVGAAARRMPIRETAPEFVDWVATVQADRHTEFA